MALQRITLTNRQVKRNICRFPQEFMFQLTRAEMDELVPIWHQFKSFFEITICDL